MLQPSIISEPFSKWCCDARCTKYVRPAALLVIVTVRNDKVHVSFVGTMLILTSRNSASILKRIISILLDLMYLSVMINGRIVCANQFPSSRLCEPLDSASCKQLGRLS